MSIMQNRSYKTVTEALSVVSKNLNLPLGKTRSLYYDPRSYRGNMPGVVSEAMKELGFVRIPGNNSFKARADRVKERLNAIPADAKAKTLRDIADALGISQQTVQNAFCKSAQGRLSQSLLSSIQEAAKRMDYVSPMTPEGKKRTQERLNAVRQAHFWKGGNFHTKEEEVARMRQLREEGYSNMEIAKKIGRSYQTVRKSIGTQPTDMTLHTKAMSGAARTKKTQERKVYVADHTIRAYNDTLQEINTLRNDAKALLEKADSLEKKLVTQLPDVKKAQKVATLPLLTIEPAINLASAQPTTIQ